jgi:hypothetical protein
MVNIFSAKNAKLSNVRNLSIWPVLLQHSTVGDTGTAIISTTNHTIPIEINRSPALSLNLSRTARSDQHNPGDFEKNICTTNADII